jgi:hypothetical protein
VRPIGANQQGLSQVRRDLGGHPTLSVVFALGWVPEVIRHDFSATLSEAGHGSDAPVAAFAQPSRYARSEASAPRVFSPMPSRAVLQRCDVVDRQEFGEPVAPLHREDRGQGVELERPRGFVVGEQRARDDVVHRRHFVRTERSAQRSSTRASELGRRNGRAFSPSVPLPAAPRAHASAEMSTAHGLPCRVMTCRRACARWRISENRAAAFAKVQTFAEGSERPLSVIGSPPVSAGSLCPVYPVSSEHLRYYRDFRIFRNKVRLAP